MCARVLLPAADDGVEGVQARLDRIERRMAIAGVQPAAALPRPGTPPAGRAQPAPSSCEPAHRPAGAGRQPSRPGRAPAARRPEPQPAEPEPAPSRRPPPRAGTRAGRGTAASRSAPAAEPAAAAEQPPSRPPVTPAACGLGLVDVRRAWPDVVERTKSARRLAWSLLSQSAQVHALDGTTLTVAFVNGGSRDSFARNGCDEVLRQVLIDVLGVDWRVESIVDPSAEAGAHPQPPPSRPAGAAGRRPPRRRPAAAPADPTPPRPPRRPHPTRRRTPTTTTSRAATTAPRSC